MSSTEDKESHRTKSKARRKVKAARRDPREEIDSRDKTRLPNTRQTRTGEMRLDNRQATIDDAYDVR